MAETSLYTNSVAPVTSLALTHSTVQVDWYEVNTPKEPLILTSGSSSGSVTITVASTEGIVLGSVVSVTSGTGAFIAGTVVTIITSPTTFLVSLAPSTSLSGATIVVTPPKYRVLRLVRNQYAFSENQEDGEILYEYNNQAGTGITTITTFTDGVDTSLSSVPLVSGQYAYYTVWVLLYNIWVNAGTTSVLLPKQHSSYANTALLKNSHTKIMELLPRTFTSVSNSPFDAIDQTSDLYKFIKGISLTYDEMLTYADLTVRSLSAKYTADSMVLTAFNHYGLRVTSTNITVHKKNLISKAPGLLAAKGTKETLAKFVETFTGFNTTVTDTGNPITGIGNLNSSNLLLNPQDSGFHKGGLGLWREVSNAVLSVETSVTLTGASSSSTTITVVSTSGLGVGYALAVTAGTGLFAAGTVVTNITNATTFVVNTAPSVTLSGATISAVVDLPLTDKYAFKSPYRLKVVTLNNGILSNFRLGTTTQTTSKYVAIGQGIPVLPGEEYSFSWMGKFGAGSAAALTPYIIWCDAYGNQIQTDDGVASGPTASWARSTFTSTAPGKKVTAISYTVGASTTSITTSAPHGFTAGDVVVIDDEDFPYKGIYTTAAGTTGSTIVIPAYRAAVSLSSVSSSVSGTRYTFTLGSGDTELVKQGQLVTITSGTGTLGGTTRVLLVTGTNTFVVDVQPSVALSGATISLGAYTVTNTFTVFKANTAGTAKQVAAKYALLGFKQAVRASTFYLDAIKFSLSQYTEFVEARCVDVYVEPSKINHIPNPSFRTTLGWSTLSSATLSVIATDITGLPRSNLSTGRLQIVSTSSVTTNFATADLKRIIVTDLKNGYHTFSIYIKGAVASTLRIGIGTNEGANSVFKEQYITVTTEWQRVSISIYMNNTVYPELWVYLCGTSSVGETYWVENAQLEEGQKATDYFDGSFVKQGAQWIGGYDTGKSYLYVNKAQKMAELSVHMNDWVPLNMTWMVRSAFGIEAIGIPSITTFPSGYDLPNAGRSRS